MKNKLEKVKLMSDEELNKLIAEDLNVICCSKWTHFNSQSVMKTDCGHEDCVPVQFYPPDYCKYLDLIHKTVSKLKSQKQVEFCSNLYKIIGNHDHAEYEVINATARQRAEALYLTIAK